MKTLIVLLKLNCCRLESFLYRMKIHYKIKLIKYMPKKVQNEFQRQYQAKLQRELQKIMLMKN